MDLQTQAVYAGRARIIKAMSHPVRLFIIDELSQGEKCVAELTGMVGLDISTVSKHLSILKNAGILASDKRGAKVFYLLRVPCITNFFGCVEAVMRSTAEEQICLMNSTDKRRS